MEQTAEAIQAAVERVMTEDLLVKEAAEWLDEHWPTEEVDKPWYDCIDLRDLDMKDGCYCVCGQLGAVLAAHEGYDIEIKGNFIVLAYHRAFTSGYAAMIHPFGLLNAPEKELAKFLAKRLGADHIDGDRCGVVPSDVAFAFDSMGPGRLWKHEIEKRRRCSDSP
jgi:hypothetical protein